MIPQEIRDSIETFFAGQPGIKLKILSSDPLSGGCINSASRLNTTAGEFCLKYNHRSAFPGMFESESHGLLFLKDANEIRVPRVIHVDSCEDFSYILLEFIPHGRPGPSFMAGFGRALARLHRHTSGSFGLDRDNYMGSLPQSNRMHPDWPAFFAEERLIKQVTLVQTKDLLSNKIHECFERLYLQLDSIFPKESPCLLHGDLWGGNYLADEKGEACLIDPAVYFGHREIDVAMTTLFGGFGGDFYTSYNEVFPLEKGWRERMDICNLYPLLIHLNLFGRGYLGQVESIVKRF